MAERRFEYETTVQAWVPQGFHPAPPAVMPMGGGWRLHTSHLGPRVEGAGSVDVLYIWEREIPGDG